MYTPSNFLKINAVLSNLQLEDKNKTTSLLDFLSVKITAGKVDYQSFCYVSPGLTKGKQR